MSTSLLALRCQSGLDATLETPIRPKEIAWLEVLAYIAALDCALEHASLRSGTHWRKTSGPSRIRTWDQSVMSAEFTQSIECQRVLPSGKPLEFQERAEPVDVHTAPGSPSVTDRFGTYLVPRLPIGQLFTVNDLAARWSVCTATIYSLAKSGRLESLRIGNSIRFKATVVVSYEQNRIGAKAERHILPRKRVS